MSISTVQLQGALKRAFERKAGRAYSPASESLTYAERAEKRVNAFLKGFKLRPHGKTVTHLTPKRGRPYPVELADGTTAYMGEPLTAGNSKLDPSVLTFDTPAIVTCGNCKKFIGGGDWNICCREHHEVYPLGFICYKDSGICEKYEGKE